LSFFLIKGKTKNMKQTNYNLEDRLVTFAIKVKNISDDFLNTKFGNNLAGQVIRSSTSTALNYAEALSAESPKDFVHKMKIVLKELRECKVALKLIYASGEYKNPPETFRSLIDENDQLIAIFVSSIKTVERNNNHH